MVSRPKQGERRLPHTCSSWLLRIQVDWACYLQPVLSALTQELLRPRAPGNPDPTTGDPRPGEADMPLPRGRLPAAAKIREPVTTWASLRHPLSSHIGVLKPGKQWRTGRAPLSPSAVGSGLQWPRAASISFLCWAPLSGIFFFF